MLPQAMEGLLTMVCANYFLQSRDGVTVTMAHIQSVTTLGMQEKADEDELADENDDRDRDREAIGRGDDELGDDVCTPSHSSTRVPNDMRKLLLNMLCVTA